MDDKTSGKAQYTSREEILDFLSRKNEIYFKSQQIDDPDLTVDEKKSIAGDIFNESHVKFLSRFGRYLQIEHLNFFYGIPHSKEEDDEIKYIIENLHKSLENKNQNIRNRRYAAMQAMIKEDDYFSEKEMMRREPHLYEQLVGQYLTDTEKRIRDGFDPKNTPFSKVLLDNIDKERIEELRKEQERADISSDEETSQNSYTSSKVSGITNDDLYPKIPASYKRQWGNFEDEGEEVKKKTPKPQRYVTAGEREMLRQEFVGIMHENFLEGKDKDFDYSKIDDNSDLDDLKQISQDKEDEYFDDDNDEEDEELCRNHNMGETEDELDIYMEHLSRHPTLKDNSNL